MVRKLREMKMREWKSSNTEITLTAAALAVVIAFIVATGIRIKPDTSWQEIQREVQQNALYERDEMKYKLLGLTEEEVVALVGNPNRTAVGIGDGDGTWYYDYPPTHKYGSTKRDVAMWVGFYQHQVSGVLF